MAPEAVGRGSMAFTVPETELTTLAEMKPLASAMICPTRTGSPFLTTGTAGLPMCWLVM